MPVKPAAPRCRKLLKSGKLCDKRENHPGPHQGPMDKTRLAREWYQAHPGRSRWLNARARARSKGVPFTILFEELPSVPNICPVLGIALYRSTGQPTDNSPSLDRIIPSLGYAPGNVRWISHRANTLKSDASPEELILIYQDALRLKEAA